ncbi:uncharacterized protein [Euphorbia lathyris]|uniref:uncharacterized protein n=1 Tax=Euphorbia lathyris TaxID=212925 RepID=UPI003313B7D3
MDDSSDKRKRKELLRSSSGPAIKIRIKGVEMNSNTVTVPKSEVTDDEGDLNGNGATIDEAADDISFRSENMVYTLSKPPQLTEDAIEVDTPLILSVKNALKSFLLMANPSDIGLIITQANNIFGFLQGLNAEYLAFYNNVRAYIGHCLELHAADQELNKWKQSEELVSHYDQLVSQSIEAKTVVFDLEIELVQAQIYMLPLQARIGDTKKLLEKYELELKRRKMYFVNLVDKKAEKMEATAALEVELNTLASIAEQTRSNITANIERLEKAKICINNAKNQLEMI